MIFQHMLDGFHHPEKRPVAWRNTAVLFFVLILFFCFLLVTITAVKSMNYKKHFYEKQTIAKSQNQIQTAPSSQSDGWKTYQDPENGFRIDVPEYWIVDPECEPEPFYDGFCTYDPSYAPAVENENRGELLEPVLQPPERGAILSVFIGNQQNQGQQPIQMTEEDYCGTENTATDLASCSSEIRGEETYITRETGTPTWRIDQAILFENTLGADISVDFSNSIDREMIDTIINSFEFIEPN